MHRVDGRIGDDIVPVIRRIEYVIAGASRLRLF